MKLLSQTSLLLLALMVVFAGCDAAQNAAKDAAAKAGDMAGIDFGDFDMSGMKEKITGVTDGFKDVTADNAGDLSSKITDLSESVDASAVEALPAPAKTAVTGLLSGLGTTVSGAMEGISDDSILSKLKPAVDGLMEKINAFK